MQYKSLLFLFIVSLALHCVAGQTLLQELTFDKDLYTFTTPSIPSVQVRFVVSNPNIVSGQITFCQTQAKPFIGDAIVSRNATHSVVNLCFPISTKCSTHTIANPTVIPTIAIQVKDVAGTTTSFTNSAIRSLFPALATVPQVQVDVTQPFYVSYEVSNNTKSIFVRAMFNDAQVSNIANNGKIDATVNFVVSGTTLPQYPVPFTPYPDQNGYFYADFSPDLTTSINWVVSNFEITDSIGNKNTTTIGQLIVLNYGTNAPIVNSNLPVIVQSIVSPSTTITTYQQLTIVKYELQFDQPELPPLTLGGQLGNWKCNGVLLNRTSGVVYCPIPPYSSSSTYNFNLLITNSLQPNSSLVSYPSLSITYTNPIISDLQLTSTKFNVINPINGLLPFNLQWNFTFTSTQPVQFFSTPLYNGVKFDSSNLVEGNLFSGTISASVLFDSYSQSLNSTSIDAADSTNDILYSFPNYIVLTTYKRSVPTLAWTIDSFKTSSNGNWTLDLTSPSTLNKAFLISLSTNQGIKSIGLTPSVATVDKVGPSYGNIGYIAKYGSNGVTYETMIHNGITNAIDGAYYIPYSIQFDYSTSLTANLLSQCLNVVGPKLKHYPTLKSFTITPNIINVVSKSQVIVFIIEFDTNSIVQLPKSIEVSSGTSAYDVRAYCYQSTQNSTITTFSCSKVIPQGLYSQTLSFTLKMISSIGTISHTVGYSQLMSLGGAVPTLNVVGVDSLSNLYRYPTITSLSFNQSSLQLSFQVNSQVTGILSTSVVLRNSLDDTFKSQTIYQYSAGEFLSNSIQVTTIPLSFANCNDMSIKSFSLYQYITIVVVDANKVQTTYPWGQLIELFPTLVLPPNPCQDRAAPLIQEFTYSPSTNTDSSSAPVVVTVRMRITDNLSGFKNLTLLVQSTSPNSNYLERFIVNQTHIEVGGIPNNAWYKILITFPINTNQSITFSVPTIYDTHENVRTYNPTDVLLLAGSNQLNITSSAPVVVPTLVSYTYNSIVDNLFTVTLTTSNVAKVFITFDDVNGQNGRVEVQANPSQSTPNQFDLTYQPSTNGLHYFTIKLVGTKLDTIILDSIQLEGLQGGSFVFTGLPYNGPIPTSIVTSNVGYTIGGVFTFTQYQPGYRFDCLLYDGNVLVYQNTMNTTNGLTFSCNSAFAPFTTTKVFHWEFNLILQQVPNRYMSDQELVNVFGLQNSYTLDGASVIPPITSSTSSSTTSSSNSTSSTSSTGGSTSNSTSSTSTSNPTTSTTDTSSSSNSTSTSSSTATSNPTTSSTSSSSTSPSSSTSNPTTSTSSSSSSSTSTPSDPSSSSQITVSNIVIIFSTLLVLISI